MSWTDSVVGFVTERSAIVVVVMLLLTVAVGSGMVFLDDEASLDQFEFETEESEALDYIDERFDIEQNQTAVQIVIRDENALTRESFIDTIELQQDIRNDEEINATLAEEPFADLATVVATTAIRQERAGELEARQAELEGDQAEVEETATVLTDGINETTALQREFVELNASFEAGDIDEETYQEEADILTSEFEEVESQRVDLLDEESATAYQSVLSDARSVEAAFADVERAYQAGEIDEQERDEQLAALQEDMEAVYERIQSEVLAPEFAELAERGEAIEADAATLEELDPSLEAQREQLESMDNSDVEEVVEVVLGEDAPREVLVFVPTDFEPGSVETDARQLFVTQTTEEQLVEGEAPERIVDTQLAINSLVDERFDDGFTFGIGVITDEINRSMADSLAIVLPLALLFVVVVLSIAYRDPLDILLGIVGIGFVLVWTFGFMGWVGISFNQIMIAVPVLLVGLSIDYAIHVFMRHRERRAETVSDTSPSSDARGATDTRRSMAFVLVGLGAALTWVTITAVIGFLSNLVSPVAPIREFGIASAFGIAATFLIFGTFVPAAKVSLDSFFESRGWDRQKRAFGTGGGAFTRVLSGGRTLAQVSPVAVLFVVLVVTAGGIWGATQVDTAFEQEDFIADEPPDWMKSLPEPFAPGEYSVKENLDFVNERFLRQDTSTQVLIRDEVTSDDTLERIDEATEFAAEQDVVIVLSDGSADVRSPLTMMEEVAATNETFNATFHSADTTGDGIPDENLTAVYDGFFETAPDRAGELLARDGGDYEAARMTISIQGGASAGEATDATRDIAALLDGDGRSATATGQLVVFNVIEDELFNTVIESLLVTLVAVFAFLMVAYRLVHGSALLGAVTLTPIVLTVAWILGTMYLLDIPFNVMTGTITSLTIGLGVAYNIHMSERYRLELRHGHDVWEAMDRAVTGTGGALLGSAGTTVGGFGVLIFAILPPLQQFGLITGVTIIYAFLGSVFVLPSLLILWTRYLGPADQFPDDKPSDDTPDDDEPSDDTPADEPSSGAPDDESSGVKADGEPSSEASEVGSTAEASKDSASDAREDSTEASASTSSEDKSTGKRPQSGENSVSTGGSVSGTSKKEATESSIAGSAREGDAVSGPERFVDPLAVRPGETYTVRITVPVVEGQVTLRELTPTRAVTIDHVTPAPVESIAVDGQVHIEWETDSPQSATVTYTGQVPEDMAVADIGFSGTVTSATEEQPVTGDEWLRVTVEVLDRVTARGVATEWDLRAAADAVERGILTEAQYRWVVDRWTGDESRYTDGGDRASTTGRSRTYSDR